MDMGGMDMMDMSAQPSVWGTWTATPVVSTIMAIATVVYLYGVVRVRRAGQGWPVSRTLSWFVAMVLLVISLNSSLAAFSHHLFWAHMIVHLLMIMLVPLFLVLAQPIRLASMAVGGSGEDRVERFMNSAVIRWLTSPVFTVPLYTAVLILTHLTGFQQAMFEHMWIHDAELVLYLVTGYLFLLPLVGDELTGHDYSYPVRFFALLISMGPDTLVGVTLMMTGYEIAPGLAQSRMSWPKGGILNPDAMADQSAAGAIMWFAGDGLMMCLLVVLAWEWIRADGLGRGRQKSAAELQGDRRPSYLEVARRSALGTGAAGMGETDFDDDDAALAAYNARLAALNNRASYPGGRSDTTGPAASDDQRRG